MGNTHGIADMAKELQATTRDLLPACIVTTTWPTVPVPPSLTLAAFATAGYVKDGVDLVYCAQEAHTVILTGGDGTYWLALTQDSWTTYATWNRVEGTQYAWKPSATRPPDVDGVLVFGSLTVSGGNITAATPAPGVTRAEALRALAALGTLATQNANAVAITGGTIAGLASLATLDLTVVGPITQSGGNVGIGGTPTTGFEVFVPARLGGLTRVNTLGVQVAAQSNIGVRLDFSKTSQFGLWIQAIENDASSNGSLVFANVAGATVGTVVTTATATAYNTSSDARLKHAIATLAGALDAVRALRPVAFRWNADGSPGVGFLAHELMHIVPSAVSGQPDEVNNDGSIKPQQVDHSRLVVFLVGAVQELLKRVETLELSLAP